MTTTLSSAAMALRSFGAGSANRHHLPARLARRFRDWTGYTSLRTCRIAPTNRLAPSSSIVPKSMIHRVGRLINLPVRIPSEEGLDDLRRGRVERQDLPASLLRRGRAHGFPSTMKHNPAFRSMLRAAVTSQRSVSDGEMTPTSLPSSVFLPSWAAMIQLTIPTWTTAAPGQG